MNSRKGGKPRLPITNKLAKLAIGQSMEMRAQYRCQPHNLAFNLGIKLWVCKKTNNYPQNVTVTRKQ